MAQLSDYDLVLEPPGEDPLGLMLYRRPRTGEAPGLSPYRVAGSLVAETGAAQQHWVRQDEDDWSGGSFYSRRIVPNGHAWTENGDASLPGLFLPAGLLTEVTLFAGGVIGDGEVLASAEFGEHLYFGVGNEMIRLPGGTATATVGERDFGAPATIRSLVVFNGVLYAGGSGMMLGRKTNPAGTWEEATFGRRYLDTVQWRIQDVPAWRLVGCGSGNNVNWVEADPFTEADWTPTPLGASWQRIGNDGTDVTTMVAAPRHIFFVKSDTGLHSLDAKGDAPCLTPWWKSTHSVEGQTSALLVGRYVYVPTRQGLVRVDVSDTTARQDRPDWCHPGFGLPNETPARGEVTALCSVAGAVVAALWNGTDSYLCWGYDRADIGIPGGGPMVWYTKTYLPGERITHLRPTAPNSVPRLWIGSVAANGIPKLRWLSLPKGANPIQEYLWGGDHQFATSCVLVTASDVWGNAAAKKTMRRLGVTSEDGNLGVEAALAIDLAVDSTGVGNWTEQQIVRESPYATFLTTNELTGYRTVMRVRGSGTPTHPPILRGLVPRADLYVEQDELWVYQVVVGDGVTKRDGGSDDRDQGTVHDRLKYLAGLGHMTMRDELGNELEVIVQPALPWEAAETPTVPNAQQRIISLTVSVVERPFYWDVDGNWDAGRLWG